MLGIVFGKLKLTIKISLKKKKPQKTNWVTNFAAHITKDFCSAQTAVCHIWYILSQIQYFSSLEIQFGSVFIFHISG